MPASERLTTQSRAHSYRVGGDSRLIFLFSTTGIRLPFQSVIGTRPPSSSPPTSTHGRSSLRVMRILFFSSPAHHSNLPRAHPMPGACAVLDQTAPRNSLLEHNLVFPVAQAVCLQAALALRLAVPRARMQLPRRLVVWLPAFPSWATGPQLITTHHMNMISST